MTILKRVALVIAVTIAFASAGASHADAATWISRTAITGPVTQFDQPGTTCKKTSNSYPGSDGSPTGGGMMTAGSTVSPQVYGINFTSGVDKQYVSWRIRVINKSTGATVGTSDWAPVKLAADNAPVSWANGTWSVPDIFATYVVQSEVIWYYGGAWKSSATLQISNYSVTFNGSNASIMNGC